jgi:hypothetical protein
MRCRIVPCRDWCAPILVWSFMLWGIRRWGCEVRWGEVHSTCEAVGIHLGARSKDKEKAVSQCCLPDSGGRGNMHWFTNTIYGQTCHPNIATIACHIWIVVVLREQCFGPTAVGPKPLTLKYFWISADMTYLAMNQNRQTECSNLLESVCEEQLLEVMSWSLQ